MKYFTVTKDKKLDEIILEINFYFGRGQVYALERPYRLTGNAKVLPLRATRNSEVIGKVDGPGFLIEELYEKFKRPHSFHTEDER